MKILNSNWRFSIANALKRINLFQQVVFVETNEELQLRMDYFSRLADGLAGAEQLLKMLSAGGDGHDLFPHLINMARKIRSATEIYGLNEASQFSKEWETSLDLVANEGNEHDVPKIA